MINTPIISASILSADIARLGESVTQVLTAGAEWIHVDVMDRHYVPNLTFGPLVCKALRSYGITAPLDVHLMVDPVDALIEDFAKAGATLMTIHPSTCQDVTVTLQRIRSLGCKAGLAFNPAEPLPDLTPFADHLDMILLMSVNPGFAAQSFMPVVLPKLEAARAWIDQSGLSIRLEVDGGINPETLPLTAKAGADTFVAGNAIFGQSDYKKAIHALQKGF